MIIDTKETDLPDQRTMHIDLGWKFLPGISADMLTWLLLHIDEVVEYKGNWGPLFSHCYTESEVTITQVMPGISGRSGCSKGSLLSIKTRPGATSWEEEVIVLEMNEHNLTLEFVHASRQVAILDQRLRDGDGGLYIQTIVSFDPREKLFGELCPETNRIFPWVGRLERSLGNLARTLPDLYQQLALK